MEIAHLRALFKALETMEEGEAKQRVREMTGYVYHALHLADERAFVAALASTYPDDPAKAAAPTASPTTDPFLASLERPTEVVQDDTPIDLTKVAPPDGVDMLVNLGIAVLTQRGTTAGLEDVLAWYENLMLHAMEREEIALQEASEATGGAVVPLTASQHDLLLSAMDNYRRVLIQDGGTPTDVEALLQLEDAILDQLGGYR